MVGERDWWRAFRRELPVVRELVYLNHAGIGPLSARAAQVLAEMAADVSRSGDRHWPERNDETERARRLAAELLGARRPEEVAFVPNTSAGLSAVAWGLEWAAGDNVVGAVPEFPSNVYPWMALRERGVEYRRVPERDGRLDPAEVLEAVDERTRVLALSWVQYASGYRADLERLGRGCRERGVLFVVDAAQGLGALRLAVEDDRVDVVAAAAHKWLLGPEGVGVLYVSDRVVESITPPWRGWRSVAGRFTWGAIDPTLADGALRFECGTLNVYGIAALAASLELLLEAGPKRVEARVLALADRVRDGLRDRGWRLHGPAAGAERSGIVAAVPPAGDAESEAERLAAAGIVVAERVGRLRVSPHFYTAEEEVDRFLEACGRGRLVDRPGLP